MNGLTHHGHAKTIYDSALVEGKNRVDPMKVDNIEAVDKSGWFCSGMLEQGEQGLSRLCVQRVIRTPRTLFFDSLDTQKFLSGFADDDFS